MKICQITKILNEMDSSILSSAPQGGTSISCGDTFATGDFRMPKVVGKMQRRKRKKDEEEEGAAETILRIELKGITQIPNEYGMRIRQPFSVLKTPWLESYQKLMNLKFARMSMRAAKQRVLEIFNNDNITIIHRSIKCSDFTKAIISHEYEKDGKVHSLENFVLSFE